MYMMHISIVQNMYMLFTSQGGLQHRAQRLRLLQSLEDGELCRAEIDLDWRPGVRGLQCPGGPRDADGVNCLG